MISSLLNFYLNKKLVFQCQRSTFKTLIRYYSLAIPLMASQVLLTQGVYAVMGITDDQGALRTLIYAIVMAVLYLVSFVVQQRWVFANRRKSDT